MKTPPRVLSGIQPTGKLHLGNYLGALKNWVGMQDEFPNVSASIVSWTSTPSPRPTPPRKFKQNVFDTALDFLAAGLDPSRSAIFIQSQLHSHL